MLVPPESQPKKVFGRHAEKRPRVVLVALAVGGFVVLGGLFMFIRWLVTPAPDRIVSLPVSDVSDAAEAASPSPALPSEVPVESVAAEPEEPAVTVEKEEAVPPKAEGRAEESSSVAADKQPEPVVGSSKKASSKKKSTSPKKADVIKREPFVLFERSNPWQGFYDLDAFATFRFDKTGRPSMQLTYNLQSGRWVRAGQAVDSDFSDYTRVKFQFRGEGGNGNDIELSVEDANGTVVSVMFKGKAGAAEWIPVNESLSDLTVSTSGKDGRMNWSKVRRISLAVSGQPWTGGTVWFKDVRFE